MIETNEPLVAVETVDSEFQGRLLINLLDAYGIAAAMDGGFTSHYQASVPGKVRVLVAKSRLEEARKALEEARGQSQELLAEWGSDEPSGGETPIGSFRRFGIWTLVLGQGVVIAAAVAFWLLGGDFGTGLVAVLGSLVILAAVASRPQLLFG
ncbi:MAG: putative signal transducing protein [Pirellulaceae bacterium]|jgi:hypothetical protein